MLEKKEGEGKLLLSLDSGWMESPNIFSQLHLINEVMHQYEYDMELPHNSVKPHEVFDMIIGAGSGGLLAAMLGPLKMTTPEALSALYTLHQTTFNPTPSLKAQLFDFVQWLMYHFVDWFMNIVFNRRSHEMIQSNSSPVTATPEILGYRFTSAFQKLVEQRLGKDGILMKMQEVEQLIPQCKFAVTALTSAHVALPTVFRGYRSRMASPNCTLVDAIRATVANARIFPPVTFGDPVLQTYIGADAGHPNPIETVLREAETIFRNKSIAVILSIGSGKHGTISVSSSNDFAEAMIKLVSSSEAASQRAGAQFSHHHEAYCRLNVDQLQDTMASSSANVEATSRVYLAHEEVGRQLDALVELLRSRPSTVKVEDIGRAQSGGLAQAVRDLPVKTSTYDNLKMLSYAERASFNPDLVCLKGTRTEILTVIFEWMVEPSPKPVVMWLEGVFGSGKSFVAHTVAVEAHRLGILCASFFMTPGTTVREVEGHMPAVNEPPSMKNLVTSLIIDLGGLSEAFRWAVGEILNEQPRLASATPSVQMKELFLPSLSSLSKDRTFVWVIDGFDELMRYPDRDATDRFFDTFCSLLPKFPDNFITFVTSRPLPNHTLPKLPTIHHLVLDLLSPQNILDIDLISYAELEKLGAANLEFCVPPQGQRVADAFRRKAGGHPLWLRVVREHLLTSLTPNEELEDLVNLEGDGSSDYNQLMTVTYSQVITRSIDLNNSKNRKALKHVVFVLLTLQRPLPLSALLEILNGSPDLPSATFKSVASRLRPLLLGFDGETPLEFIHLSLRDFFISSASFSDLIQDVPSPHNLSAAHFTLLESAFRVMTAQLRPEVPVEQYHLDHPGLAYVAGAWPTHLIHLNPTIHSAHLTSPLTSFLDRSFLAWLGYHQALGLPFLFTREFLERAKCFGGRVWDEKVLSKRQIAEKLNELREQFEQLRRFDDWQLCSEQAVQLWRAQAGSDMDDRRSLYMSLVNWARGLRKLGLNGLSACQEAVTICRSLDGKECQGFKSEDLAFTLRICSLCLSEAGRHAEALAAIDQSVVLRRQLVQDRPGFFEDDLARSLNSLSHRLSNDGRHAEALAASEEAVSLNRRLVQDRPNVFEDQLALSLNNLSISLSDAGRDAEALTVIEEAVSLYRQLIQDCPRVFEADLARSLNNFFSRLSNAGRQADALAAIEEAVLLRRQLVQDRPQVFEADLAHSLNNFSISLSNVGRQTEALAANEEAISIFRRLVQDRPKLFEAELARSLNNISLDLSGVGRHDEALATIEEAVSLYREVILDRPKVFEAEFVRSLDHFSDHLSHTGRHTEALAVDEEVISLYRQLVKDRPGVFEEGLACSLNTHSNRLSGAGRYDDALPVIEEAVSIYRQLVLDRPNVFEDDLAESLDSFSRHLTKADRDAEALAAIHEAVSLYRQLVLDRPNFFEDDLAESLERLSNRLSDGGRHTEALAAMDEAVSLYRRLVLDRPNAFEDDLARSLEILHIRLSDVGQRAKALVALEEAVSIYRQLVSDRPGIFEADLALSLNNCAVSLSDVGRHAEALPTVEDAVSLYRRLAEDRPRAYEAGLANSLDSFSTCYSNAGRHPEALAAIDEAVSIYRRLVRERPNDLQDDDLVEALKNLSNCPSDVGRHDEALTTIEEVVSLYQQLADDHPHDFEESLQSAIERKAELRLICQG